MDNPIYEDVRGVLLGVLAYMGVENTHKAFINGYGDHDGGSYEFAADTLLQFLPGGEWNTGGWFEDGWEVLGAGAFSIAFRHPRLPKGQIIKVSLVAVDIGPAYWAYCLDHAGERFIPEVIEHGHDKLTGWRWCIMEECEPCPAWESRPLRTHVHTEAPEIYLWAASLGCVDLHAGNVMWSKARGNMVITDPVSMTPEMRERVWG